MNKKKIIIIVSAVAALLIVGLIIFFATKGNGKKEQKEGDNSKETITITFDTDGGNKIEDMKVTKGSKFNLPTAEKEGFTFIGWFNGETNYTDENTNTIEKNIVLTAKWKIKEPVENNKDSINIIFDSKGGSKVNSMTVKCVDNVATISNLPTPTKDFYNFMSWEDKHGKSILNGAKLTCDTDLTLYAIWEYDGPVANPEQNNVPDTKPTPQKSYKCPSDFELKDGTKCVKLAAPEKYCQSGWKEVNGECVNPSSPNPKGTRTCPSRTYSGWTGTGTYYEAGRGYCGYYELTSYIGQNQNCKNAGGTLAANNHCYKYIEINYATTCANDEKNFESQVIAPGNGGGCYQVKAMSKKCPDGYTNASVWGECALVQDAVYE